MWNPIINGSTRVLIKFHGKEIIFQACQKIQMGKGTSVFCLEKKWKHWVLSKIYSEMFLILVTCTRQLSPLHKVSFFFYREKVFAIVNKSMLILNAF